MIAVFICQQCDLVLPLVVGSWYCKGEQLVQ